MSAHRYDLVALGEVMVRLDPGDRRIRSATSFDVWIGGGEYNVAHALSACFGRRTAAVTALVDNELGALVRDRIRAAGVDDALVRWLPFDGIGSAARNGLNFTERGFGARAGSGEYDRSRTAASLMRPGDVDWDTLFADGSVGWLHTGGVFASLTPGTAELLLEAVTAADRNGVRVSFDLNVRPSLWRDPEAAERTRRTIAAALDHVHVLFANTAELDRIGRAEHAPSDDEFERMVANVSERWTGVEVMATSLRDVRTASRNGWGAIGWSRTDGFRSVPVREVDVLDRVGGGDAFAAGVVHGLQTGRSLEESLALGTAHGALVMSTPGDTSSATLADVERAAAGVRPATVR